MEKRNWDRPITLIMEHKFVTKRKDNGEIDLVDTCKWWPNASYVVLLNNLGPLGLVSTLSLDV